MKNYFKKLKLFIKEVGNFITNLVCPVMSLIVALLEICGLPIAWIKQIKKLEYWFWNLSGTVAEINQCVNQESINE